MIDFVADGNGKAERGRFQLLQPEAKMIVKTPQQEVILELSKLKDGKFYITTNQKPFIMEMVKERFSDFNKTGEDFRDKKHPFAFADDKVKKIELRTQGLKLNLVKAGTQWSLVSPVEGKELDQPKVESLLEKIKDLKVQHFLGKKNGNGLQPPRNRVALSTEDGLSILELMWGEKFKEQPKDKAELFYVRTSKVDETFGVLESSINSLSYNELLKDKTKPVAEKLEQKNTQKNEQQTDKK